MAASRPLCAMQALLLVAGTAMALSILAGCVRPQPWRVNGYATGLPPRPDFSRPAPVPRCSDCTPAQGPRWWGGTSWSDSAMRAPERARRRKR